MNPLIEQLLSQMTADLEEAITDLEDEMLEALQKMRANRDDEDEKPLVFSCSLAGKLNLDKNTIETAFSFSVKTKAKNAVQIEDPNQGRLL